MINLQSNSENKNGKGQQSPMPSTPDAISTSVNNRPSYYGQMQGNMNSVNDQSAGQMQGNMNSVPQVDFLQILKTE